MLRHKGPAPPELEASFRELYFTNPWIDNPPATLVYEGNDGRVVGFLGVVRRKMSLCGKPVRVAFGGNFVVDPEARTTLAGLRLLSKYMAGDQELSMTDSANDMSRTLLERMGFRTLVLPSIHWVRPLRPTRLAVYTASRVVAPAVAAALKPLTSPFCALADSLALRFPASPFRLTEPPLDAADLDAETLLRCLVEFRKDYSLWSDYDSNSLEWLLSFIERRSSRGVLRKLVLRNEHEIAGWYIYYVKPGGVGEVVQIGASPRSLKHVLDHLFYDAWRQGVIALHGVIQNRMMPEFSDKNCLFTCHGGWTVAHSRKAELLDLLDRGGAFLSRLDGEWCLAPGA
jgi:hypothetical protein